MFYYKLHNCFIHRKKNIYIHKLNFQLLLIESFLSYLNHFIFNPTKIYKIK